ncbi:MAG: hypothetical protein UR99_C0026G0001 [Candidatus Moranbacteria bacterium GW2011_GWD2_36_12]|nr:MAG: hypothetical protein UR99_C0026G0001 [Candidatus Moranbacteria bacterium GW2011_GWD2_36_12]
MLVHVVNRLAPDEVLAGEHHRVEVIMVHSVDGVLAANVNGDVVQTINVDKRDAFIDGIARVLAQVATKPVVTLASVGFDILQNLVIGIEPEVGEPALRVYRLARNLGRHKLGLSERLFSFLLDKSVRECVIFPGMKSKE